MRPLSGVSEAELHAYADSQLTEQRAREVAAWLSDHPAEGVRVGGWRAQNEAIRRAFPAPPRERLSVAFRAEAPAPEAAAAPGLAMPSIEIYRSRRRRRRALATALAFMAGAVTIGAAGLLFEHMSADVRPAQPVRVEIVAADLFAEQAAAAWRAYAEDRQRPVELFARDKANLAAWLAERTGLARLPESAGLRLIGGRVLPGHTANAAFLLYETSDGERVALLTERGAPGVAGEALSAPVRAIGWRVGDTAYALAGKAPETRLRALAEGFSAATRAP